MNTQKISIIAFSLAMALVPAFALAENISFNTSLSYGMKNNADVVRLQQYLTAQGFYSGPVTGNYLTLTRSAVQKFQSANGLPSTGYFGPLSRAKVNSGANVATFTLMTPASGALLQENVPVVIRWESQNYSSQSPVNIVLMKKVSDNPNTYELVKTIVANTPNDGGEIWVPTKNEVGSAFKIQIGCGSTGNQNGCIAKTNEGEVAISAAPAGTGSTNLASIITALQAELNKILKK